MLGRDQLEKEEIYNDIMKMVSKDAVILKDELMSKHTSFKIGGPADIYAKVKNTEDIISIINYANKNNIKINIVGNGSNLLVKDNGIRGITLRADLDKLEIDEKNGIVTVGSGVLLSFLAQVLLKKEYKGFEFAYGIPGTIGGAVRMNAGAHGKEMKDIVVSTKYLSQDGQIKEINNQEHEFQYRNSIFETNNCIILETKIKLEKGNYEEIKSIMTEYSNYRKNAQPIEFPNAGSTFKRGDDFITAKLIDECGLKGYRVGDAEVSTKHAGFVVNKGSATAKDVIELVNIIKQKIKENYGKNIELEVQIIGE